MIYMTQMSVFFTEFYLTQTIYLARLKQIASSTRDSLHLSLIMCLWWRVKTFMPLPLP